MILSLTFSLALAAECPTNMVPVADGQCCWPGQTWDGQACSGVAQCPAESTWTGETCTPTPKAAPIIIGDLALGDVERVLQQSNPLLTGCYEPASPGQEELAGRVTVRFTIKRNGAVRSAEVADSTIQNPQIEQCLVGQVRTLRFPSPVGSSTVIVSYPFVVGSP